MRKMLTIGMVAALLAMATSEAEAKKCKGGKSSCGSCYTGCYTGGCYSGSCGVGGCPGGVCSMPVAGQSYAMVVVDLPAEARLTIDGQATTSTSGQRTFQTPELEDGKSFHYTLRAEVNRGGRVQTITERITVRAGETTRITLNVPAEGVASR